MNIKSLSAAAVFLAVAFSAHAQIVNNDIVVGFRGSSSVANLEVNAGLASSLAADTTQTLIGNLNSALTSSVGLPNWATATGTSTGGVFWGAAGTTGSSAGAYASVIWDNSTPGTLGTANSAGGVTWNNIVTAALGTAATNVGKVYTGFNSVSATATGDGISKTIANGNANSWTTAGGTGAAAFAAFNPNNGGFTAVVGINIDPAGNFTGLDLYKVTNNASQFLGTFALYTSTGGGFNVGDLTFTAAIPEPSVYAAILGVATLGFAAIRRRKQASLVA
jgi:hypothetical protein